MNSWRASSFRCAMISVSTRPGATALTVIAARGELQRQRLRERDQPALGRRVVGLAGVARDPADRDDVDDPAPALVEHPADQGLRHAEGALEVDVEDVVPVLFLHEGKEGVLDDAGVVDEDVGAAEVRGDAVGQGLDVLGLADVDAGARAPLPRRGGSRPPSPRPARCPAGRSARCGRPPRASSSEIARPMPREPPVTTAVFIAAATISTAARIDSHRSRPARQRVVRSIQRDHLREHLARAGLEEEPVAVGDHRLEGVLPERREAERRAEQPADVLAAGDRAPLGTVVRHARVADRPTAPRSAGAIASATGRISSLWIGQLIVSGRTESARGRSSSSAAATPSARPVRTNCVDALTLPIQTGRPRSRRACAAPRRRPRGARR